MPSQSRIFNLMYTRHRLSKAHFESDFWGPDSCGAALFVLLPPFTVNHIWSSQQ